MGMFDSMFKKNELLVAAPVKGKCVSIKEVSDPTFSDEVLGKGVAIIPSDGLICSPADGTVSVVFPTGHAVAVTTDWGAEILVHIGLDTVKLEGRHYTIRAQQGQKVSQGDILIEADIESIKAEGYDVITPVLICNSENFKEITGETDQEVEIGTNIMRLRK